MNRRERRKNKIKNEVRVVAQTLHYDGAVYHAEIKDGVAHYNGNVAIPAGATFEVNSLHRNTEISLKKET